MNTPFLLASDSVATWEVEPWEEQHQRWRVLEATFDPSVDTHRPVQRFYFDANNHLVRHGYFTEVGRGTVSNHC